MAQPRNHRLLVVKLTSSEAGGSIRRCNPVGPLRLAASIT